MGVFRSIPMIETGLPFLHEVDFDRLGKDLEKLRNGMARRSLASTAAELTSISASGQPTAVNGELFDLIDKYPNIVGIQSQLDKVRLELGTGSIFITGPRDIGKTTLVEELVRLRASGRLSGQMSIRPFFVFDPVEFFTATEAGKDRPSKFRTSLKIVADNNGLLIFDHIDDFVQMAAKEGADTLLLNILVTTVEQNRRRGMRAIAMAEDENEKMISDAADSFSRAFSHYPLTQEPNADELKTILTSAVVKMEVNHNLNYTEAAIDEAIRLLARFPGRAFTEAKPGNHIRLLNLVGSHVRRNLYAEPPAVTEMRERLTTFEDQYEVLSAGADAERLATLCKEIAELRTNYAQAEGEWHTKFAPLFKAKENLEIAERELPALRTKRERNAEEAARYKELKDKGSLLTAVEKVELDQLERIKPRTQTEEQKFSVLTELYARAPQAIAKAEQALYPEIPLVTDAHVRAVFNRAAGISAKSKAETRARLASLPDYVNSQIFSQSKAKKAIINAYKARETGVKDPSKPIVILYAGGSGLGKTELTKAMVRYDLGLENRPDLADQVEPITLSLSEFTDKSSVSKLGGASPGLAGYDDVIPWHEEVRKFPRSIFLFDEGDKAHPDVFLSLMQVFETGKMKDSHQHTLDFKDMIIVVTINGITSDDIPSNEKDNDGFIFEKICHVKSANGEPLFTPAIVNRFDFICVFDSIDEGGLVKIMQKEIRKVNADFRDQGLIVTMDDDTAHALVRAYPDPGSGGRAPRKIVGKTVRPAALEYVEQRDAKLIDEGKDPDAIRNDRVRIAFDGQTIVVVPDEQHILEQGIKHASAQITANP